MRYRLTEAEKAPEMVAAPAAMTWADLLCPTAAPYFRAYLEAHAPRTVMGNQNFAWDNPLARWLMDAHGVDVDIYSTVARMRGGEQVDLPDWMRAWQRDLAARAIADEVSAAACLVSLDAVL